MANRRDKWSDKTGYYVVVKLAVDPSRYFDEKERAEAAYREIQQPLPDFAPRTDLYVGLF